MPIVKKTIRFLFPSHCWLCDFLCQDNTFICNACYSTLPHFKTGCIQCGSAISHADNIRCGQCLACPPPFNRVMSLFHYKPPISSYLLKLKFHGDLSIAQLLSRYWIEALPHFYAAETMPALLLPVPLHHKRLVQRGFNQSLEIAKPVAKHFHLLLDTKSCIRIKNTIPQSALSSVKRKNNLNNAFALSYPITAKHVAILDDVMTTGNTVSEIAHLLRKVGVEKIDVWCCARA